MATLNEVMKDTADAIREKTGKSDLIAPINFAEEIKSISVGGGESGGSNVEYLDVSGVDSLVQGQIPLRLMIAAFSYRCKYNHPNGSGIKVELYSQVVGWVEDPLSFEILALEIDFKANCVTDKYGQESIEDKFSLFGITQEQLDSIPRITKEQFYDLNA